MTKTGSVVSSFSFGGKLTKIYTKKNKIKYIKLVTKQGKYWLKITKKLRKKVANLSRGCQIEVAGKSRRNSKTGKVKYEAQTIVLIPQDTEQTTEVKTKIVSLLPVLDTEVKSKARVLICQKSNCWKKGGQKVYRQLESTLSDRGLSKDIPIKKTGCLKKCKQAPTIVMLPDKARYSKVKPKQIPDLVDKHLIAGN
ncbi:ferredoxin [Pleurocapsa sp. PCC 7319]|uniref:(2Fe-2S) ferredoxin domain-containing protein n=1 Tax=Pleurocapsa sp. PCC 7319 TaxID=118161 RepID=UPI000345F1E2|nr:(2Fe-2S) ferredoxin domain-containing protein [Pleurocapsa sp. PCC 7319]